MDIEHLERAKALRDDGQLEEALREFRTLAESTPDPEEKGLVVLCEVGCLGGLGRVQEARQRLRQAAELLAGTVEYSARIDLADACLHSAEGKYKQALAKLDRIAKKYAQLLQMPEVRDLYEDIQFRRGMLLVEFRRYQEARPILEEALAFDTEKKGDFYCQLGVCYFWLGELELAKQRLLEAFDHSLDDKWAGPAHYYLGSVYPRLGAYARGKQEFEEALALAGQCEVPRKYIYDSLAKTCRALALDSEAERYAKLAKSA